MSIYLYTLRKSKPLALKYNHKGKTLNFPIYNYKFAFSNCDWDYTGSLKLRGADKTKHTKADRLFGGKKMILVRVGDDIYLQEVCNPFWFDVDDVCGRIVGEIRHFDPETGDRTKEDPFLLDGAGDEALHSLIKEHYPNVS